MSVRQLIDDLVDNGWTYRKIAKAIGCYEFNLEEWYAQFASIKKNRLEQLHVLASGQDAYYVLENFGDRWIVEGLYETLEKAQKKVKTSSLTDNEASIMKFCGEAPWYMDQGLTTTKIENEGGMWISRKDDEHEDTA